MKIENENANQTLPNDPTRTKNIELKEEEKEIILTHAYQ